MRPPIAADVEEWSWIERRNNAIMVNSSRHSLQDLAALAKGRRRGICPGACVFRDRDQLWIPLTEVRSQPEASYEDAERLRLAMFDNLLFLICTFREACTMTPPGAPAQNCPCSCLVGGVH